MPEKLLISLGANQFIGKNPPEVTLRNAISALSKEPVIVKSVSKIYQTPCFPPGAGPDFANAVCLAETRESPSQTLARLHEIEAAFHRERAKRWGERTLDLDLLAYGDRIVPNLGTWRQWADLPVDMQMTRAPEDLILPHPRIQDRAFVLVPLAEIAPDWQHPVLGKTARALCAALPAAVRAEIRAI